jgi:hypothetical protein
VHEILIRTPDENASFGRTILMKWIKEKGSGKRL